MSQRRRNGNNEDTAIIGELVRLDDNLPAAPVTRLPARLGDMPTSNWEALDDVKVKAWARDLQQLGGIKGPVIVSSLIEAYVNADPVGAR